MVKVKVAYSKGSTYFFTGCGFTPVLLLMVFAFVTGCKYKKIQNHVFILTDPQNREAWRSGVRRISQMQLTPGTGKLSAV